MRYHPATALIPLLLAAAFAGCASPNARLRPDPNPSLSDVPVPVGFCMTRDSQTYSDPIDHVRIARQHYDGHDHFLAVAAFYRVQLPPMGWKFQSQWQDGRAVILTATKGTKVLTISIANDEQDLCTEIHVNLDANGRDFPLQTPANALPTPG